MSSTSICRSVVASAPTMRAPWSDARKGYTQNSSVRLNNWSWCHACAIPCSWPYPKFVRNSCRQSWSFWCPKPTIGSHEAPSDSNQYRVIYTTINENHDPLKIVQTCNTRWLSIETAVTRILDQWIELTTHFQLSRKTDMCFVANMLYDIYSNAKFES